MQFEKSGNLMHGEIELHRVNSSWKVILDHLEEIKSRIHEEIRNYPPPIPACDAQFNSLLEQRDNISRESHRLDSILRARNNQNSSIEEINEYIRTSTHIDDEAKRKLAAALMGT